MTKSLKTAQLSKDRDHENHLHLTEARWFAVYTGYKHEKKAAELLEKKGITAYVPVQKVTRVYTRKKKQVELPLINCYVFVKITKQQYVPVLETQLVHRFLTIRRNLLAIPEAEIELLRQIVGEAIPVEVDTASLHEGDAVEVVGGQLTGLQGVLIEKRGRKQLVIALKTLGYDLLMEVKPSQVRKMRAEKGI